MSIKKYSLNNLMTKLALMDREENLERQKAQRQAQSTAAGLSVIPSLIQGGLSAGSLASDLQKQDLDKLKELASYSDIGEEIPVGLEEEQRAFREMSPAEYKNYIDNKRGRSQALPAADVVAGDLSGVQTVKPSATRQEITQQEFYDGNVPTEEERNPFFQKTIDNGEIVIESLPAEPGEGGIPGRTEDFEIGNRNLIDSFINKQTGTINKLLKTDKTEDIQLRNLQEATPAPTKTDQVAAVVNTASTVDGETTSPSVEAEGEEGEATSKTASTYIPPDYKPIHYKYTPEKEADRQLQAILEAKKPHPLLNLVTLGAAQGNYEAAVGLAKKIAVKQIRAGRAEAEANNLKAYKTIEDIKIRAAKQATTTDPEILDAKKQTILANARAAEARAKTAETKQDRLEMNFSDKLPPSQQIESFSNTKQLNNEINDQKIAATRIIQSGKDVPFGLKNETQKALIAAIAAKNPGMTSTQIADSLNEGTSLGPVGFSEGKGMSKGAAQVAGSIDYDTVMEAYDIAYRNTQDPEVRELIRRNKLIIQKAGKLAEGGKLSDADMRFYLANVLSMSSPEEYFSSLDYLQNRITSNYHDWRDVADKNYKGADLSTFPKRLETYNPYTGKYELIVSDLPRSLDTSTLPPVLTKEQIEASRGKEAAPPQGISPKAGGTGNEFTRQGARKIEGQLPQLTEKKSPAPTDPKLIWNEQSDGSLINQQTGMRIPKGAPVPKGHTVIPLKK